MSPLSIVDEAGDIGDTESMILSEEDRRELAKSFPGRCVSRYWLLAFPTLHHGFSLKSLYRNCQDHDGPSLLVIQSKDQVSLKTIQTEKHKLNNFHILGNLWGVFVRRAESEREILWYGRVLAVFLLLRRHEDLQLAGGQQLHPQGQPQLPHHRVRYVEDCKMWNSCGNYFVSKITMVLVSG